MSVNEFAKLMVGVLSFP